MHSKAVSVFFICLGLLLFQQGRPCAAEQSVVDTHFESFCRDWLRSKQDFAIKKMKCRKFGRCFIAEYDGYSDEFSTRVKVADPAKKIYVGILTYHEVKRENQAATPDSARNGPFRVVTRSRVKEIFMYRNGKWQY